MDPKNSPTEGGQPLLPLRQDPPEYSSHGFPPSEIYPSTSGRPAQQYGAPAAPGRRIQGPYPGQTVVTVRRPVNVSFTPLTNPQPDYLCYSIFTMLCCCLPLGSAALVYSITPEPRPQHFLDGKFGLDSIHCGVIMLGSQKAEPIKSPGRVLIDDGQAICGYVTTHVIKEHLG
ncbi:hypothetical protein DPX16_6812 [Anabarilius grahami]|uniref:Uncharacterized protein n=1 Tax=Anabarilius grahami TaxID=495550 RepID=A0A3N0Y5P6_ANAGA|nr:hypothetical protein DPX16_6812 [Anabarilius grahami]